MPDVPMREVVCHHCSRQTSQPFSTLEPVLWLQAVSSEDGIYINYACPMCGRLTRSRVESGAKTVQNVESAKSPDDLAAYIVFLKCTKAGCESPVILLAPMKNEVREADLIAHIHQHWSAHGAACAKGHPPAHPYEVRIWKQLETGQ
jgi:hypothetical protein